MVCLSLRKISTWVPSYLLGNKSYSLIIWNMTPFKEEGHHTILELLYNKKTQIW